jgi:C4-dicarboxylate-specific signal transduction histidine kinase/ActR/RegA family two-component response regulator
MEPAPGGFEGKPGSLRRRIFVLGMVGSLLLICVVGALAFIGISARTHLVSVTEDFIEEQQIADRITHAVMRQLAATSALRPRALGPVELLQRDFQRAGDEVHGEIRRYLFRDLSPEERLQLEQMGEEHQRMEVAASQASDLLSRGLTQDAEVARETMFEHLLAFLESTGAFLRMRELRMAELQSQQEETFQAFYLLGGLLVLLLVGGGLVLAWLLHRRIAQPLQKLAQATEELGGGDLSVRLPPDQDLEFQVLVTGFNRMAGSLERTTADLERRNQELSGTLGALQEAQAELIQAEKLSAMGRMTAGLAHELNNPLAGVVGYGQLLAAELEARFSDTGAEISADLLTPLLHEAERAQNLVRNFLHFARRAQARLQAVDLQDALQVVLTLREAAFRQAGFRLEVGDIPSCQVKADEQMLQGVFLNVLNNALDAMESLPLEHRIVGSPASQGVHEAPALRITGTMEGERIRLQFEDDGPGMEQPNRVFEPFYTTKPVGKGTGLGLALSHRFAAAFGGELRAENRVEGGARLVLELLVVTARDRLAEEQLELGRDGFMGEVASSDPTPTDEGAVGAARAGILTAHWPDDDPPGVLVVEDEVPLRQLQERLLKRMGVRVFSAGTAMEAREVLERDRVDLILCDVKMPGESGLDLYRWLERNQPERTRRFLFVTGDVDAPELVELAEQDPSLFLRKPFNISEYLERVTALLVENAPTPG